MAPQPTDWSKTFPILKEKTYLCSHSLGAVPVSTADALRDYYEQWARLGIQAWEGPWWQSVVDFGKDIEKVLRAKPDTIVPFPNATRAMAAVTSCLDYGGKRNKVVMTDLEFTTFYPFWRGQERLGAKVHIIASKDGVTVPTGDLTRAIDDKTLLVATCHGLFRSGAVQDLRAITEDAHRKGALVLGDGYQTAGTYPVDVTKDDIDFYVGGSHKYLCGGPGGGFLYVRPDRVAELRPRIAGWFGLKDPFGYVKDLSGADLHPGVMRLLDGTPNVPGLVAAREGIRQVLKQGIDSVRSHSLGLTRHAMKRADEAGLEVRTPRKDAERTGMVCLRFDESQAATKRLVSSGTIVDWRPECGMRMSPHFYNSQADVDRLFDQLRTKKTTSAPPRAA